MGIPNWGEGGGGGVPPFSRFFCRRPLYKVDQISSLFLLHLHSIFSVPHPPHSHRLRHHCLYLLPLKCRRLQVTQSTIGIHVRKQQRIQVAVDCLPFRRIDCRLRLFLLLLLFLLQNQNVRILPNHILLWLHGRLQLGPWNALRNGE